MLRKAQPSSVDLLAVAKKILVLSRLGREGLAEVLLGIYRLEIRTPLFAMKMQLIACLVASAFVGGCSNKDESVIMKGISPSRVVEAAGKDHGVLLSSDSEGAGMGGGYANRSWTYFSPEKGVSGDSLKAIAKDATEGIRKAVIAMGAKAEPVCAWTTYFHIHSFGYSHQGRRGSLRVTAAALEKGTVLTVIMEERPE